MGAALYWAEGSKGGLLQITNSDPHMIVFMVNWVERIFGTPAKSLRARLNIYPQQNEHSIKKFWSRLTGIPLENFGKSYVKPFSTGYKKNNLYYGTMRLEVPKSVDMRHHIFGWVRAVMETFDSTVHPIQREWISLKKVARPVNLRKQ